MIYLLIAQISQQHINSLVLLKLQADVNGRLALDVVNEWDLKTLSWPLTCLVNVSYHILLLSTLMQNRLTAWQYIINQHLHLTIVYLVNFEVIGFIIRYSFD